MAHLGNTLNTLHEKLVVVHHPGARGFGAILSGGVSYAPVRKSSSRNISSVVRFTSQASCRPSSLRRLIAAIALLLVFLGFPRGTLLAFLPLSAKLLLYLQKRLTLLLALRRRLGSILASLIRVFASLGSSSFPARILRFHILKRTPTPVAEECQP